MGGRDLQAAQDLALVLRAGALPVPLKIVEGRNIGASLGQDSIDKGICAGDRRDRVVDPDHARSTTASPACWPSARWCSTCSSRWPIARRLRRGAHAARARRLRALTIGIAVDANVLIFERIREELGRGKTVRTAIDEGFKHAL